MQGRKAARHKAEGRGRSFYRSAFSLPTLPCCLAAFCLLVLAGVLMSGCVRAQAKVTPDQPLDVPAPPPREVDVNDSEPPPPVPLVTEPARNAPSRSRPAQPQRTEPARPDPTKPDQPLPPEAPKPPEEIKPPAPPAPPPTVLQTTPATAEGEVERAIRVTMGRATNDLNRIDYRALSNEARTQYDQAKRFVQQADAALREKNHQYARTLADKAAVMAAQLAGR